MIADAPAWSAERIAIEDGLARYARALDTRDWGLLDTVFAPDAVAHYGSDPDRAGRSEIVGAIRGYLDRCGPTQHLIGNVEVDRHDRGARTRCAVQAAHRSGDGTSHLMVLGRYDGEWQRRDDGWRVTAWRMHVDLTLGDPTILAQGRVPA